MLKDAEQDAAGGGFEVVAGMGLGVVFVRAVDSDIGMVCLAATGNGDIEVLPRRRGGDNNMGGVSGDALRPMGGDRISKV